MVFYIVILFRAIRISIENRFRDKSVAPCAAARYTKKTRRYIYEKNHTSNLPSPRRKEILKQMGVQFSVLTGNCEENPTKNRTGRDRRRTVPGKKPGRRPALLPKDCIVIGADTVVAYENKILGKAKR